MVNISFSRRLLIFSALVVSILNLVACSKQEPPVPTPASDTCSYILDGRATTGTAKWISWSSVIDNVQYEALVIQMSRTPTPGLPAEAVMVSFRRPVGAPVSAYEPISVFVIGPGRLYVRNLRCTLVATADNGYSGTFAATSDAGASYPTSSLVTEGVFTDAHR